LRGRTKGGRTLAPGQQRDQVGHACGAHGGQRLHLRAVSQGDRADADGDQADIRYFLSHGAHGTNPERPSQPVLATKAYRSLAGQSGDFESVLVDR
jgi:hypothetical protein